MAGRENTGVTSWNSYALLICMQFDCVFIGFFFTALATHTDFNGIDRGDLKAGADGGTPAITQHTQRLWLEIPGFASSGFDGLSAASPSAAICKLAATTAHQ